MCEGWIILIDRQKCLSPTQMHDLVRKAHRLGSMKAGVVWRRSGIEVDPRYVGQRMKGKKYVELNISMYLVEKFC